MANEINLTTSLSIRKGNLRHTPGSKTFRATLEGDPKGPVPGAIAATLAGVDVDLSELEVPGICTICNLDEDNYIEYGISDGTEFYPLGEVLPGEEYTLRLSRLLGRSIGVGDVGTGTYDSGSYSLRVKATVAPCNVVVSAFEA